MCGGVLGASCLYCGRMSEFSCRTWRRDGGVNSNSNTNMIIGKQTNIFGMNTNQFHVSVLTVDQLQLPKLYNHLNHFFKKAPFNCFWSCRLLNLINSLVFTFISSSFHTYLNHLLMWFPLIPRFAFHWLSVEHFANSTLVRHLSHKCIFLFSFLLKTRRHLISNWTK